MRNISLSALVVLSLGLIAGCGSDGPQLAEVSGKVTLDGKPVPNAVVTFNPLTAGGSNSLGKTDAQGVYRLEFSQDKKGAMLGEHEVEIVTKKIAKSDLPDDGSVVATEFVEIPAKYRKRGSVKAVVENKSNTINFELDSK